MDMAEPMISIVTVVRNNAERLQSTMQSVARYKNAAYQYVVVDGASTDDTLEVIRRNEALVDLWISEPDSGIYHAMNKAVALCRGRYILFLNAGDELISDLAAVAAGAPEDCVLQYGRANMINPDGTLSYVKGKRLKSPRKFLKGMPLCHQAILYRRTAIPAYDLRFRIFADRLLTYRLVRDLGLKRTRFLDATLVNYIEDGFSCNVPRQESRKEESLFYREVGKPHYIVIKKINALFKQCVKLPISNGLKRLSGK
jgi:glycosyltransferase involved in cell wall biosynthesis